MNRDMVDHHRSIACGLALGAVLVWSSAANAARPPTLEEREAITTALPTSVRNTPVECLWLKLVVSTRNPNYAFAGGTYLNARNPDSRCVRYARNGFEILRKTARGWRIVYSGSEWPKCSLGIPRDLIRCRR